MHWETNVLVQSSMYCKAIPSAKTSSACIDSVGLHVPLPSLDNWLVCCHENTIRSLLLICPRAPDSPFPSVAPSSAVHRLSPVFPPSSLDGPQSFSLLTSRLLIGTCMYATCEWWRKGTDWHRRQPWHTDTVGATSPVWALYRSRWIRSPCLQGHLPQLTDYYRLFWDLVPWQRHPAQ